MRRGLPITFACLITLACSGGERGLGETCASHGDCDAALQCSNDVCVPRCQRSPDCGDGYGCDDLGLCQLAAGQLGDSCTSEAECGPGLSCHLDKTLSNENRLLASCTAQGLGAPAGALCADDLDCRNGTCALGRCVDVCTRTRDCARASSCTDIPASGGMFGGCLPSSGNIQWTIPVKAPASSITFPVPAGARSAQLTMTVSDPSKRVGAKEILSPSNAVLYRPCQAGPSCNPEDDFYQQPVRHQPLPGQSVLVMPQRLPLESGAYRVKLTTDGSVPRVLASVRLDVGSLLDLHFHFLNFDDHMCPVSNGLRAESAPLDLAFQNEFVATIRTIFSPAGIAVGDLTYRNVLERPDLDGLDVEDVGELLELANRGSGINVFFVRTLSPVGIQGFAPNPGPAGFGGTMQSGVVIGLDTLCYRSWTELARLTAHELARYMGLFRNVEANTVWEDNLADTPNDVASNHLNLMFYSEFGGIALSASQIDLLRNSGVLR
jgi:hypothetical protein